VWQYGSNNAAVAVWEQDGIVPQCPIPSIEDPKAFTKTKYGRIFIPANVNPKKYMECHMIVYYFWLFSELNSDDKGYVKKRN